MTTKTETMTATPEERAPIDAASLPAVIEDATTDVALLGEEESWLDVDDGDLAPEPATGVLSLIPLNKKLDGGFTDIETGETRIQSLDFVWLAKGRSRGAFIEEDRDGRIVAKPYDAKNAEGPGCRSFDGVTADPNAPMLQNGGDCTTCPLAQYNGDEKPICREAMEAMVFIPDPHGFGRLARIRFNGIAIGPARRYWRSFNERLPKKPPIAYVTHCELEETLTPNGTFLAPKFNRAKEFTRAEVAPLIAERDRRLPEWRSAVAEDVSSGVAGDTGEAQRGDPFEDEVRNEGAASDARAAQEAEQAAFSEEPF